ncbi:hypothetical protein FRC11_008054, partial [Ceratobasidium sp. 423]
QPPIIIQPPAVITSPVPISSNGQTQGSQPQPPVIHVSPSSQSSQGPQIIRVGSPSHLGSEPQIIRIGSPGRTLAPTTPGLDRIVVEPSASSSGRSDYYPHDDLSHRTGSRVGTPRMRVPHIPHSRPLSRPVLVDVPHRTTMSDAGTERYYPSSSSQSGAPGIVYVQPRDGGRPIPYAPVGRPGSPSGARSPTHIIVDADGRRYREGARSPPHLVKVVRDSPSRHPILTLPRRSHLKSFTSSHRKAFLPLSPLGPPLKSSSGSLRPLAPVLGPTLPPLARTLSGSALNPRILLAPDVPALAPLLASLKSMVLVHAHGPRVAAPIPPLVSSKSALVHARNLHDPYPALIRRLALFGLRVIAPRIDPAGPILRALRELFMWALPSHDPTGRAAGLPGPVLLKLTHLAAVGAGDTLTRRVGLFKLVRSHSRSHSPTRIIGVEHDRGRSRSPTHIVRVGSSRSRSHSPPRVIHVHGSSETRSHSPPRIIRVDDDRSHRSRSPTHYPREIHVVGSGGSRARTPSRSPTRIIYNHSPYGSRSPSRVHTPRTGSRSPIGIIRVGSPDRYEPGSVYGGYPASQVSGRPTVIRVGSGGPVQQGPDVVRITSPKVHEQPQVVRVGGTPSQTPTPQVIRVTSPQAQSEEPSCIIRVGVPRTTLPSYLPTDADKQSGEPAQRYLSHISEESAVSGASEIPPVIEIPEPRQQRPPVHRTASGRTEAPPPQVIRIGAGSRAGRSDVPAEQIRVTTPGPIEYPYPPQVIHIGTSPSEDYPPQIVRVGSTKPVPQPEAPPTIVRIPTVQGKPEYQTHIIRVASPPAVVAPSAPHVVQLGTPSHAQEEPQWIRVKSPPRQIIDPVPQVVHLKSAPQAPVGPQIICVATAIPQPDPTPAPAQVFRIGTPAYPEPPQIVRVGTAKPTLPDKLEQIIRIGTPSYPEPLQTPQVIRVGVQPPQGSCRAPGGVPPAPHVIRVTAPHKEAPSPVEVMCIGSPTMTAPTELQVIRVTSPPAQPQESPERLPVPTETIRIGSTAPTSSAGPQVIRLSTSYPAPEPTQITCTGTAPPSKPQVIHVTPPPSKTEIIRLPAEPAPAGEGPQVICVTSPLRE